jgi:hypothetical protein
MVMPLGLHARNLMRCVCHKYRATLRAAKLRHQLITGPYRCAACNADIANHDALTGDGPQSAVDHANTASCCDAERDDTCDATCRLIQAVRITARHTFAHKTTRTARE